MERLHACIALYVLYVLRCNWPRNPLSRLLQELLYDPMRPPGEKQLRFPDRSVHKVIVPPISRRAETVVVAEVHSHRRATCVAR